MMAADPVAVLLTALLASLGLLGIILLLVRIRRRGRTVRATAAPVTTVTPTPDRDVQSEGFIIRRQAIVERLESIDQTNRRQMRSLIAVMVDSGDWQELGQQLVALSDERVEHLRVLAQRHDSLLTAEKARFHTLEAYRLALLIFALHEELIDTSDVVREYLDGWFRSHRRISLAEFSARINLDCARTLLLDLDYARPEAPTALRQLDLASEHCADIIELGGGAVSQYDSLLFEITLRKERLTK